MHARIKKDFVVGVSEQVVEPITKPGNGVGRVFNGDEELQLHREVNDGAHGPIEQVGLFDAYSVETRKCTEPLRFRGAAKRNWCTKVGRLNTLQGPSASSRGSSARRSTMNPREIASFETYDIKKQSEIIVEGEVQLLNWKTALCRHLVHGQGAKADALTDRTQASCAGKDLQNQRRHPSREDLTFT